MAKFGAPEGKDSPDMPVVSSDDINLPAAPVVSPRDPKLPATPVVSPRDRRAASCATASEYLPTMRIARLPTPDRLSQRGGLPVAVVVRFVVSAQCMRPTDGGLSAACLRQKQ